MTTTAQNQTWLDFLDPVKLVDDEKVKKQFIDTYSKIHKASPEDAEVIYNKEVIYYKQAINSNEKLKYCTKISLYSSFLEIAIQGLSIQPGAKSLCYLESRSTKVGDNWISTCKLVLTTYGELELRIKSGQIVAMLNPIVVYEGDHFQPRTNQNGEIYVDYAAKIPRASTKIIACWVRIAVPGGINDFKWLLQDDIDRLAKCSEPRSGENKGKPNSLYTSVNGGIDPGFLEAKTIKHAMRSKGKLKVSDSVAIEGEEEEEQISTPSTPGPSFAEPEEKKKQVSIVTDPNEAF